MVVGTLLALLLSANDYLARGRALTRAFEYEKAVVELSMATQVPQQTAEERYESFVLLALAYSAIGRADAVEQTFTTLLTADPEAALPEDVAPKIREGFRRARERLYPPGFVQLRRRTLTTGAFAFELVDPYGLVAALQVCEARAGATPVCRPLPRARFFDGQVAAETAEFSVEGRSTSGEQVVGFREVLLRAAEPVARAQRQKTPLATWLLGAAAVAMLGAGTGLAIAANQDSQAAGRAHFASDIRALDDAASHKALAANVLFGASLAAGIGAVVVFRLP